MGAFRSLRKIIGYLYGEIVCVMHYRQAAPEDAPTLAKLNQMLIRDEGHRNLMSLSELTGRMRGWLEGAYQAVLFESDEGLVGYALFRTDEQYTYLRQFYINPAHRRRGLGRAALEWLIANTWTDASRLRLEVLCGNAGGIAFWRALGFEDYCLTMEREL